MQELQEINSGAVHAIKGYRRQFLYTLYRLLKERNSEYIFEPEGFFEDLDIKDQSGSILETIQVKNTSGTLVFSDLFSKSDSFYKRAKKATNSDVKVVKLACFGNLSEELKDKSLEKIKNKLVKKGFRENQISKIADVYDFEIVLETEIQNYIIDQIKGIDCFIDPEITIDLLLFWLYKIAEKRISITSKEFVEQLNLIGKYASERIDFHKNFGSTIKPLEIKEFSKENHEKYQEGFYIGVSAKYEHILADVDIKRVKWLQELKESFNKNSVVFIHGASGQGKSSLAYRYLKESQSQFASYELKLTNNYKEVLETINSLEALCKGLDFPVILYIDVVSQYLYWQEVIKELYDKSNLHFLITIRQEDWNRLSIEHQFSFTDIELNFDKSEAQQLYIKFSKYKPDLKFISFEESWEQVGENSPLLEYVYFITQGFTLKSRLKEQLRLIQEKVESKGTKEIEILRFVSLSDSFNSKINYKELIQYLQIDNPLLYIEYFEKEYLLQLSSDKMYLTGLHPVRSQIIADILFDNEGFINRTDYINKSISLVHEEDLHIFLLSSFNSGYNIKDCLTALSTTKLKSWSGYNNVYKALLWKGVFDYIFIDNLKAFEEFYLTYSDAWSLFLDLDYGNSRKAEALVDLIKSFHKEKEHQEQAIKICRELNDKLTPLDKTYRYCIAWLKKDFNFPSNGTNIKDWQAFGEFLFRISIIKLSQFNIPLVFNDVINFFESTSAVETMATVLLGMKESQIFSDINFNILESIFIQKLRTKYNIVKFQITEGHIHTQYFFDIVDFESENSVKNPFHEKTLEIQNIIRRAFPKEQEYEIKGFGYNFLELENLPDDTYKCMPRENLPISLVTEQNALVINLFNNSKRLKSWQNYVELVISNRKILVNTLASLMKGLITYFKDNSKGINYLIENEIKIKESVNSFIFSLPLCAVDKWGYKGEKNEIPLDNKTENLQEHNLSHQKFNDLQETRRDYFSYSRNFINQSFMAITDTIHKINGPKYEFKDKNLNNVTEVNLFDSALNLFKYQSHFSKCFEKFTVPHELKQLIKKEADTITDLLTIWKEFLYSPYRISKQSSRKANLTFELTKNQLLQKIYSELIKTVNQIGIAINVNTDVEEKRLIMLVETTADNYIESIGACVDIAINVFSSMHHTSIKNLLTKLNFETLSIVPLFKSHPINNKYFELPLYRIDKVKELIYSEQENINIFEIFQFPSDINKNILHKENLLPWNERIPKLLTYEKIMGIASSMKLICQQYYKLIEDFGDVDELGSELLSKYKFKIINHFNSIIEEEHSNQQGLFTDSNLETSLIETMNDCIVKITSHLNDLSVNKMSDFNIELITDCSSILETNYLHYSEILIENYLN